MATNVANHQLPLRVGVNSISEFHHGVYLLIKVFQFYAYSSVRNCNCVLLIKRRLILFGRSREILINWFCLFVRWLVFVFNPFLFCRIT